MPMTTRQERRSWIMEAQALIASGKAGNVVIKTFVEQHGIDPRTARRYVDAAWREWNLQRINKTRDHRLSRALARCDKAAEIAVNHHRHVVVDGALERVSEPDAKGLLAAVDTEAKLLGLFAPEKKEFILTSFTRATEIAVQCIIEEIADVPLRQRLLERMQRAYEEAAEHADAGKEPLPAEVKTIEATIVQRQDPPSTNGNGAH
jgi:hypothetical protein